MSKRLNAEILAGGSVLVLAVGAMLIALRFPAASGAVPGPALFPLLIAGFWAVLGLALLVVGFRSTRTTAAALSSGRAPMLLLLTVGYVALMSTIGFIATSALYIMLVTRLLGYRHGWRAAALGLSVAFLIYGVFAGVMNVPLPQGWLN